MAVLPPEKPLAGRLAVVTGGTRGIGRGIAERFLRDGARVIVTGTRPDGRGPAGAEFHPLRLEADASVDAFCAAVAREAPDIMVNNAGVSTPQTWDVVDPVTFRRNHQINLVAPMLICRAALPAMMRRRWGRFVGITALSGTFIGRKSRIAIASAKAGLDAMHSTLAAEGAQHNVLANCVAPGFTDTDVLKELFKPEEIAAIAAKIPMKRLGTIEEIASLVAFLAGPENTYMTGRQIIIDGGYTRTL